MLSLKSGSASFRRASEGQLRHNVARRLSQSDDSSRCSFLSPVFGGRTSTVLRGLTYPKILSRPKKAERKRENGDVAWRGSSLSWAWAAEIVT